MATPDRWPPWIEAPAEATASVTINSTTAAALTGCSITFTPAIDCRAAVHYKFACTLAGGTGADTLRIYPTLNGLQILAGDGSGQTANVNLRTVGDRYVAGISESLDLTGGTTYTLALVAELQTSTGTSYTVLLRRTHLGPIVAMPSNLHT